MDGDAPEEFLDDEETEEEVDLLVKQMTELRQSYYLVEEKILKEIENPQPYALIDGATGKVIDE